MINISGGINWVRARLPEREKCVVRLKEVGGAACAGGVFGAVSKAVKDRITDSRSHQVLNAAMYSAASIGGVAALVVGGMAGYKLVEKYAGADAHKGWKILGAAGGATLFGAGSMLAAMQFMKQSPESAEKLAEMLAPYLSNVAGAVSSKAVQSFVANFYKRESTQWTPETLKQQAAMDGFQVVRCLFDNVPRISLLSIPALTANYATAVTSHMALGAAGSILSMVYDYVRSTQCYRNCSNDLSYASNNREVVREPCKQLGMKIALGMATAWAASSIAPSIIDATEPSVELKLLTFALVGCAVNALFTEPARQLIPAAPRAAARHEDPEGGEQGPPPEGLAHAGNVQHDDPIPEGGPQNPHNNPDGGHAGNHEDNPAADPEAGVEMDELAHAV